MNKVKIVLISMIILFYGCKVSDNDQGKGTLIVLNKSEASVSIISLETNNVINTIPTGIGPHEAAVSSNGKTLVVTNYGIRGNPGSSLTIINLLEQKLIKTIQLGIYEKPHGVLFIENDKKVLVTAQSQKALLIVDLEKGQIQDSILTNQETSHMVAYSPKHELAFVSNIRSGSVNIIDIEKAENLKVIKTGDGAEGIEVTPDEKEVWITNRAEDKISIMNIESLSIVDTLECKSYPIRIKFTPDGKRALISNARSGDVAVFDVASRKEIKRIEMEYKAVEMKDERLFKDRFGESPVPIGILVHPNGREAYIANTNADIVTIIDLNKNEVKGRIIAGKEPDGLGFTPLTLTKK